MRQILVPVLAIACLTTSVTGGLGQSSHQLGSRDEGLKSFLKTYVQDPPDYRLTRYIAASVELKDDKTKDVIVYFTDQHSCGSGGCNTLILAPEGSSYKVVTSITIAKLPIRILNTRSHGWHDIGVFVQGGGILVGYEARLSFDGKSYPRNPTVLPARKLEHAAGRILISWDDPEETLD